MNDGFRAQEGTEEEHQAPEHQAPAREGTEEDGRQGMTLLHFVCNDYVCPVIARDPSALALNGERSRTAKSRGDLIGSPVDGTRGKQLGGLCAFA